LFIFLAELVLERQTSGYDLDGSSCGLFRNVLLHFHGDPEEVRKLFGDILHLCDFILEIVVLDVT
jgi:hypothetical protein